MQLYLASSPLKILIIYIYKVTIPTVEVKVIL